MSSTAGVLLKTFRVSDFIGFCCFPICYLITSIEVQNTLHILIPQVSVLTDQVEVQGEKIRDLDTNLEEHRMKLNATEELLQQV